ncbi:uncharacterized protein LOC128883278 isoform X3 [Hylaeus volcanicus]|uniref:uncharacterized protein LOC128883278 isoform X3 n=1 Tax=Hylaeus volcanicus TaxID=313075 RepID=UPI0023B86720|nr:uncharacterized protein LOC128883278 isoform X3 [Hylaeus volcanicus]
MAILLFNFSFYLSPCITIYFIFLIYLMTSSQALTLTNWKFKQEKGSASWQSFLQNPLNEEINYAWSSHALEEVYNKALGTRQRIVGTINSAIEIFSALLYDRHLLQEQKIMRLQRIAQLTHQNQKKRISDVLIEDQEHLTSFYNRWAQYLDVASNVQQPSWMCRLLKNDKKEHHSITQQNKFLISEKEKKPTSVLLLVGRHFTIGFISAQINFPDIEETKSGCAGFVFKFQNEKDYGFLTLCNNSSSYTRENAASDVQMVFGRMNHGICGILKTQDIKKTLVKKSMNVLLEFSHTTARVYLEKEVVAKFHFLTPWVDEGSVGLHSVSSSVTFYNIIIGPYIFSEFENEIMPLEEDDTLSVKTHEWSADKYRIFLAQDNLHPHGGLQQTTNEKMEKEQLHKNDTMCYDFVKARFDINDWNVSQTSSWKLIDGPNPSINRFISEAPSNNENDDSLLLKTMNCAQASISVNILMGPGSAAGITFHYVDPLNRWMCILDNGFGLLKLIHIDQGDLKIVGLVSVPTLNAFQTQFLELRNSRDTNRVVYEIWLNNKRLILHSFNSNQSETHFNEASVQKINGLGLVIGKDDWKERSVSYQMVGTIVLCVVKWFERMSCVLLKGWREGVFYY